VCINTLPKWCGGNVTNDVFSISEWSWQGEEREFFGDGVLGPIEYLEGGVLGWYGIAVVEEVAVDVVVDKSLSFCNYNYYC